MNNPLKGFFYFRKSDRKGIVALGCIAVFALGVLMVLDRMEEQKEQSMDTPVFLEDDHKKLSKGKEVLAGRDRKMKISKEFLESLKTIDDEIAAFDYIDYAESILMIHGTLDDSVPIENAKEFSEKNIIELVEVEKADHRFSDPKRMDFAIQKIIDFFAPHNN